MMTRMLETVILVTCLLTGTAVYSGSQFEGTQSIVVGKVCEQELGVAGHNAFRVWRQRPIKASVQLILLFVQFRTPD